jgi:hypothetical protein
LEAVLAVKRDELQLGARPELRALMEVPGVTPWMARALYDAGLYSPEMLLELDSTVGGSHRVTVGVGGCGSAMRTSISADAPDVGRRCWPQRVYDALAKVCVRGKGKGGQRETEDQRKRRQAKEKAETRARANRTTKNLLHSCRLHLEAAAEARAAELAVERAAVLAEVHPTPAPAVPPPHTYTAPFTP